MLLLVSGLIVAHLDQLKYSPHVLLKKNCCDLNLSEGLCIFTIFLFRKRGSRETVSLEKQLMSKKKYLSIFSGQIEAIVFISLQILGISIYYISE